MGVLVLRNRRTAGDVAVINFAILISVQIVVYVCAFANSSSIEPMQDEIVQLMSGAWTAQLHTVYRCSMDKYSESPTSKREASTSPHLRERSAQRRFLRPVLATAFCVGWSCSWSCSAAGLPMFLDAFHVKTVSASVFKMVQEN
jgi:hypothetical protein